MLIRKAEVAGEICDVRLADGRVAEIDTGLARTDGEQVADADGAALLPGLHDHHIHLNASAVALYSVRCGPPQVDNEAQLIAALHKEPGDHWLRGIGYHASVAGEIDRAWLDQNGPQRPIRIQHRGGRMWVFNSRAIALLPIDIPQDGRLVDGDIIVRQALGNKRPDLKPLVSRLLAYGITGVTEVTPGNDQTDLAHYCAAAMPLNLCIMGGTGLHAAAGVKGAGVGPFKIHNHDHDLPSLDQLASDIRIAHNHGRAVAIHCVTRAELMLSLAAIEDAGVHSGDRIEHGAIVDQAGIEWIARLGLTVVTQPHFVAERGAAYLRDVEKDDIPHLWRIKSLADAGIKLAAGSDAPFGDHDPWRSMASAVVRPKGLGAAEALTPEEALALYTKPIDDAGGEARRITIGSKADLCLLDRTWSAARTNLSDVRVRATWVKGRLVHEAMASIKPQASAD